MIFRVIGANQNARQLLFTDLVDTNILLYLATVLFLRSVIFLSLNCLQSPSNNCHTGSSNISNPHSRIPAYTAEDFFGQGTGQSPKDIGSTFLSSSEDLPDDINIV